MPASLKFQALPLTRVDLKLTLATPVMISSAVVLDLQNLVTDEFSEPVADPVPDAVPALGAVQVPQNSLQMVSFGSRSGLCKSLHTAMVSVSWRKSVGDGDYPGYSILKQTCIEFVDQLKARMETRFLVVQIRYELFVPVSRDRGTWFLTGGFPNVNVVKETPHHLEYAAKTIRGPDIRFKCQAGLDPAGEKGMVFQSIAGYRTTAEHPWEELDMCHDTLTELFPRVISENAKEAWKYEL